MKRVFFVLLIALVFKLFAQNSGSGNASWYGDEFTGKKTSSGEVFDPNSYTAAHKTLPFNTKLKVTNLKNNKSVVVRVNDRGPFVVNRILDVSKQAAMVLDMLSGGIASIKYEVVPVSTPLGEWKKDNTEDKTSDAEDNAAIDEPVAAEEPRAVEEPKIAEEKPKEMETPTYEKSKNSSSGNTKIIQVAAFIIQSNAEVVKKNLIENGYNAVIERYEEYYRVIIPNVNVNEIERYKKNLIAMGYTGIFARVK